MLRGLVRALLILVILVAAATFFFGSWTGGRWHGPVSPRETVGTTGTVDVEQARERGAELGERAAIAVAKVEETAAEATITTKIKAKMALDDLVNARRIDVSTTGSTVTLRGSVESEAERERAVRLAKETHGVAQVEDKLDIRPAGK